MSFTGLTFIAAGRIIAATDWSDEAALLASVTGAIVATVGLWRTRRSDKPDVPEPVDHPTQVSDVIQLVRDLEQTRDERDGLRKEVRELRAEVLRLHDSKRGAQ